MAFSVAGVTGYVDANSKVLLAKSILGAKSLQFIKYQPGVKGSAQINLLEDGVSLQAGACGWSAAGTTTLTKRNIVTGQFKVNESLCEATLVGTFAEWELNTAVGRETLPFEQVISETKVKGIQKAVELLAWNGDATGSTSTYLDVTDGLIKIIGAASGVVDATPTASTLLLTSPLESIALMVKNIPVEVIDATDLTVFAGYDVVMAYIAAYNASNQYHGTLMLDGNTMSVTLPNTTIKLQGVGGLNGKSKAYLTPASNLVAGGDIQGAESQFEMWYSKDNQEFRFASKFNIGFQVAYPVFVVKYTK
jgi:hypothetical protein